MNVSLRLVLAFFLAGCATPKRPFTDNFCYVYDTYLVCSEKQADGSYATVDRSLAEIKNFQEYVLIPAQDFEQAFAIDHSLLATP